MTIRGPLAVVMLVALVLSVAVNLTIAGFVFSRFAGPPRPGGEIERIVAIGIRAFPPEIQQAIADGSKARREELRTKLDAVQDARKRMFDAMRANPFDAAALTVAYDDLRARTSELQQVGQQITADAIASAPPDVRARIRPPRGPGPF
ncbi:MAG TPA: periplasmic heavy metal sensor [Bauldia sp.]|nr:periplasmic heavy metal sensor [Bauldia sp.]